jgi:hypothetical protein
MGFIPPNSTLAMLAHLRERKINTYPPKVQKGTPRYLTKRKRAGKSKNHRFSLEKGRYSNKPAKTERITSFIALKGSKG